jgi:hypothetical protein
MTIMSAAGESCHSAAIWLSRNGPSAAATDLRQLDRRDSLFAEIADICQCIAPLLSTVRCNGNSTSTSANGADES